MRKVRQLEVKISQYQENIQELEAEIRKHEQNYESLRMFKGTVEISQGEFNDITNQRKNILEELEVIEMHSITTQRYSNGMNHVLNGIGAKIVGGVYPALLFEISCKMQSYINSITDCEMEISRYRNTIGSLEADLQEAKKEEQSGRNR